MFPNKHLMVLISSQTQKCLGSKGFICSMLDLRETIRVKKYFLRCWGQQRSDSIPLLCHMLKYHMAASLVFVREHYA